MTYPDRLVSERTREFWLEAAKQGTPPSPVEVAQKQYGLMAPWHIRTTLWRDVRDLGTWPGKKKRAYNMSRGAGKSQAIGLAILWAAEYRIPFMPKLRHENRRINIIGRDERHLQRENMDTLEEMICQYAPWLKTLDPQYWEDPALCKEYKMKARVWTTMQKDLSNGVSIRGYGFAQNVRGGHVPLTFLDDYIDDEDAHHGKAHFAKVNGSVMPSVEKGGLAAQVGTPIDDNDVWKYTAEDREWNFRSFPAYDETGELGYEKQNLADIEAGYLPRDAIARPEDLRCLWPYRMSYDDLVAARGSTPASELAYLREYMMKRAAAWNLLVHPDYYRQSKRADLHYLSSADGLPGTHTFMGVDPSTLRRSNFVFWVAAKFLLTNSDGSPSGSVIRPLYREKIEIQENEDPEERKKRVMECLLRLRLAARRFRPRKVVIEGNGYQNAIEPFLEEKDHWLRGRIECVTLSSNKHFDDGWPIIRAVFENGHIEMPYGPTPSEQAAFERNEMQPEDFMARRVTDDFWHELSSVRYQNARILEDDTKPQDSVAAFYMLLRAADYVPDSVSVEGVPLGDGAQPAVAIPLQAHARRVDAELQHPRFGTTSALSKVQRARNIRSRHR